MVANPPNLGYDDSDFLKKTDPSNRFLNGDKIFFLVAGLPSLLNNRYEKQYPLSNALPNKVSPSKTEEKTRDIDEYGSDEAGDTSMVSKYQFI
uniref:Ovule protein n=1 Tax=Meloidogyne hapla TaxID=6305 RepID=A0A1I8BF44_MELHA